MVCGPSCDPPSDAATFHLTEMPTFWTAQDLTPLQQAMEAMHNVEDKAVKSKKKKKKKKKSSKSKGGDICSCCVAWPTALPEAVS